MRVGLVQFDAGWEQPGLNLAAAAAYVKRAAEDGCDLAVFPEMFLTGFSMNLDVHASIDPGDVIETLGSLARENGIGLIAGVSFKSPAEQKGRNMAVVINRQGRLVSTYTKMRCFPLAGEDGRFIAGQEPAIFMLDNLSASVFICYDLRFPELFRKVAPKVQAFFVLASWPADRAGHWSTLLRARAIENQCFVIGVNRTGVDGNSVSYAGASCVIDPMGEVVCLADGKSDMIVCDFDPGMVAGTRDRYPFLKDLI